ncbi:hypothetical protein SEVIR_2G235400v4 [Setaria viridis]|uniref:Uncharacterized protein n=2 Tax=Setaria TaxID=4554 RepID=A0A368Q1L0_SETIT|nr:hypothetical protein SETIT_2G225200v2 [Setaria italica]TKW33438.1 hypothetical protein SEVIR_2G235400v2 [Setaria viridis]
MYIWMQQVPPWKTLAVHPPDEDIHRKEVTTRTDAPVDTISNNKNGGTKRVAAEQQERRAEQVAAERYGFSIHATILEAVKGKKRKSFQQSTGEFCSPSCSSRHGGRPPVDSSRSKVSGSHRMAGRLHRQEHRLLG